MSLKKWFDQKWVDIGATKDGSYAPCGRSKLTADRKRKYRNASLLQKRRG